MVAETTRASAATPMQAIKILKATINPQRGLRLSIDLRKFSGGSGNGPVLTEYNIVLIVPLSLNQPGASLVPPRTLLPPDTFSFFGAMSAYAMLRFCSLSFVVLRKSRVWLNLAELYSTVIKKSRRRRKIRRMPDFEPVGVAGYAFVRYSPFRQAG